MGLMIAEVARRVGVRRETLLAWERRYGFPNPRRNKAGYRLFDSQDVSQLHAVQRYRREGLGIRDAVARATSDATETHLPATNLGVVHRQWIEALTQFNRGAASALDASMRFWSFQRRLEDVYLPVLRRIGDLWHRDEIGPAEEHFAGMFIRERLIEMLHALDFGPPTGEVAVCAGFPNEHHEYGLLAAALYLALAGRRVVYLGCDVPLPELIRTAHRLEARWICQSVLNESDGEAFRAHADTLSQNLPQGCTAVLGGPGLRPNQSQPTKRILLCNRFDQLTALLNSASVEKHRQ